MSETIKQLIINMFSGNPALATFVLATLPIFELRGAIPFGMSTQIWGTAALTPISSFLTSFLATTCVIPIVALVFIPILNTLKKTRTFKTLAQKFELKIKEKSNKINSTTKLKKLIGVGLFVAIPLPLTGVYTGTCIAIMLGLNFYETLVCVSVGNLVAGLIMLAISTIFKNNTLIILIGFIVLLIIFIIAGLISKVLKSKKREV